jgi:riboflavin biosynthesis pyrimidine reductase
MRVLVGADLPLEQLYAPPPGRWLRVNMVGSVDGAAHGSDGRSGSINNAVDAEVFHLLRSQADAIIVGGGTARAEGYHPAVRPLVVVSGRGRLPETLQGAEGVRVEAGGDEDALRSLVGRLRDEGFEQLLCEGGPTLLGRLLSAGLVDELCCTITPLLVGGSAGRIVDGPPLGIPLTLSSLVEQDGTLLARWLVSRG